MFSVKNYQYGGGSLKLGSGPANQNGPTYGAAPQPTGGYQYGGTAAPSERGYQYGGGPRLLGGNFQQVSSQPQRPDFSADYNAAWGSAPAFNSYQPTGMAGGASAIWNQRAARAITGYGGGNNIDSLLQQDEKLRGWWGAQTPEAQSFLRNTNNLAQQSRASEVEWMNRTRGTNYVG